MAFTFFGTITSEHELLANEDGTHTVIGDPSGITFFKSKVAVFRWGRVPFSSMECMFLGCEVFVLDRESPVFAPQCTLKRMFMEAFLITAGDEIRMWNMTNVTNTSSMFSGCKEFNQNLRWDMSNVTDTSFMFSRCVSLNQEFTWDLSKVTNAKAMFSGCIALAIPPRLDTKSVVDMSHMFFGCRSLTSRPMIAPDGANTEGMFAACLFPEN